jgi:hypothetical protein
VGPNGFVGFDLVREVIVSKVLLASFGISCIDAVNGLTRRLPLCSSCSMKRGWSPKSGAIKLWKGKGLFGCRGGDC